MALLDIDGMLSGRGRTLADYDGMPLPDPLVALPDVEFDNDAASLDERVSYRILFGGNKGLNPKKKRTGLGLGLQWASKPDCNVQVNQLTSEQRGIVDAIMAAALTDQSGLHYISASAGTGACPNN